MLWLVPGAASLCSLSFPEGWGFCFVFVRVLLQSCSCGVSLKASPAALLAVALSCPFGNMRAAAQDSALPSFIIRLLFLGWRC